MTNNKKAAIFAHRGSSHTHPENTLTSFQAAYEAGVDGIECDVQLTKDLVPVIIHDETVNRTTNAQGWVRDFTISELQQLDAGSWFSEEFRNERILILEGLLNWATNKHVILNIELKTKIIPYEGIEEKVVHLIHQFELQKRVVISSFHPPSLILVNQLNPDLESAVLLMKRRYEPKEYAQKLGVRALHVHYPIAQAQMIDQAASTHMPVRAFTVNDEATMLRLWKCGCEAIITDRPKEAILAREKIL